MIDFVQKRAELHAFFLEYHSALTAELEWCEANLRQLDPTPPTEEEEERPSRPPRRRFTPEELEDIQASLARGETPSGIAKRLGRQSPTIFKLMKSNGWKRQTDGAPVVPVVPEEVHA